MTHSKAVYIGLGSNKGLKYENLQYAVDQIFKHVGVVKKISEVYQTSAFGFEGDDFLNACLLVDTTLKPLQLLKILNQLEKDLGRKKTKINGYESRELDLDILLYGDEVIVQKSLEIPHPRLQERQFVLKPLCDIAKDVVHPVFGKSLELLRLECSDTSVIKPVNFNLKNPINKYTFGDYNYIAIEGNIGAGKTSLATKMARDFNAKLILERFADNPFLPKFYKSPERYAFTLEMSFLADRYQQISDDLSQLDLFKDFIISDYDVYKSLIFSKITLPEDEFRLYRKLFFQVYKDIAKPDLYVYLYQNTERLQKNIKKRGRTYEKAIKNEYLEKINTGYLEFLRGQNELNVKIIDISNRDFVKYRSDYLWLLNEINASH